MLGEKVVNQTVSETNYPKLLLSLYVQLNFVHARFSITKNSFDVS